jgi:predicted NUDIX family phosphoesterase
MTTPTVQKPASSTSKHDEQILVVQRKHLFANKAAWSGLKEVNFDSYLDIIDQKKEFLPRGRMEEDPTYKQIIPYLIFKHGDKYFLMQRNDNATEKRLQNKYSLGIGGHIREEDLTQRSLFDWAQREFHEEVSYEGKLLITPIGILNDDSNAVGQVHIGFVLLLEGEHPNISIKSELKNGQLLTLADMKPFFTGMESWSQIVFEFISKHQSV